MFDFPRPELISFPQVWRTFEARDADSDKIIKYRIEDVPEDRFSDVVEFMMNHFAREEVVLDAMSNSYCVKFSLRYIIKCCV